MITVQTFAGDQPVPAGAEPIPVRGWDTSKWVRMMQQTAPARGWVVESTDGDVTTMVATKPITNPEPGIEYADRIVVVES